MCTASKQMGKWGDINQEMSAPELGSTCQVIVTKYMQVVITWCDIADTLAASNRNRLALARN